MKQRKFKCFYIFILLIIVCQNAISIEFDMGKYKAQWSDKRSSAIGDIVTVLINESAKASSSAGLSADNEHSLAGSSVIQNDSFKLGLGLDSSLNGDSSTSRNGAIKARITVRIIDIDEFGMLKIAGSQFVTVNGEEQKITLNGFIRSDDLSANNFILSSRIESAKIELSGIGEVNDNRNPNIFRTLFRWLGF